MTPPTYMAYALIGGVVLVSFLCPVIVGWDDAWFVPLAVLPFAILYGLFDAKLRRDEEHAPDNVGH